MASVLERGGGSLSAARLRRESEGHGGHTVAACMRKGGWWLAEEASAVCGRAAAGVDVKFSLLCPCMLRVEIVQADS